MSLHPIRCRLAAVFALAASLLGMGCSQPASEVLRVGISPWLGYEFLYLAQEKGFYREEGLDVRLVEFYSLHDCRYSYERGQIDAMGSTISEVLQMRDRGRRMPQVVQVIDYSNGADVIIGNARIADGAGLRGARVGVGIASLGDYVLVRGLERNGLSLADITMVPLDNVDLEAAFRSGKVDALVSYPPVSLRLLKTPASKVVFSTAEIPGELVDVIAVDATVNAQRPGDIAKFLRAYNRAVEYARKNPKDAHRIMAAREGMTAGDFSAALGAGIKVLSESDQIAYLRPGGKLEDVVERVDHLLRASGQISGPYGGAGALNDAFVLSGPRE